VPQTREKVLVAAFSRALRDPHAPSRIAGISGFKETKEYYSMKDCATHVIPAVSYMTVDPNHEVSTTKEEGRQSEAEGP
jgi:SCY1-like protein 1